MYQPPYARDLSGVSAVGGKPKPQSLCVAGATIISIKCATGHAVGGSNSCGNGLFVGDTQCAFGDGGTSGCVSGNNP